MSPSKQTQGELCMSLELDQAADATTAVQSHVAKAMDALNDYRISEHDVFINPAERRASLQAAQEAIAAALKVMEKTNWPSHGDDSFPGPR
jgi:hypothetical protein